MIMKTPDYSILDDPLILGFAFYPRQDCTPTPPDATDHMVPVDEGVSVFCRFYAIERKSPTILYFHGNGEVVCDYDDVAPIYSRIGINLFVADYRGYGRSGGQPTFSATVSDAHVVFKYFMKTLASGDYTGPVFVMGRSLGSISAIELASAYPETIKGLILESGFASFARLFRHMSFPMGIHGLDDLERAGMEMVRRIRMPALIIHGEYDSLIPHSEAVLCYENLGSENKRLVTIPKADHNDILMAGIEQYFEAIGNFIYPGH
ncbi:MAG: alpha/beta hydrolase [Dehalococcoidia bacterium]|nr:alpha/beta hydrolase [Dehalococcoidia bacterium]